MCDRGFAGIRTHAMALVAHIQSSFCTFTSACAQVHTQQTGGCACPCVHAGAKVQTTCLVVLCDLDSCRSSVARAALVPEPHARKRSQGQPRKNKRVRMHDPKGVHSNFPLLRSIYFKLRLSTLSPHETKPAVCFRAHRNAGKATAREVDARRGVALGGQICWRVCVSI